MKITLQNAALALALAVCTTVAGAQTKTIDYGRTSVKLDAGFVSALQSLGLTAGVMEPSRLKEGKVTFPVTGGAIDLATAKGEIIHSGGLTLTAGSTEVRLQSFIIDTTGTPVLTGLVTVNNTLLGRLPLFNLQLPPGFALPLTLSDGRVLKLNGVVLTLTPGAASALNTVFSTTALPTDGTFVIGAANMSATVAEAPETEE